MGQITDFAGPERRRRWIDEERLQILVEAFPPGAYVEVVCRRHDVSTALIYTWRRKLELAQTRGPAIEVGMSTRRASSLCGHDRQTPSSPALRAFDQYLLLVLGHIDGYQHGVGGGRGALGHGRLAMEPFVGLRPDVLRSRIYRQCCPTVAGEDRREGALHHARQPLGKRLLRELQRIDARRTLERRNLLHPSRGPNPDRSSAVALQHRQPAQLPGLSTAGSGSGDAAMAALRFC